MKNIILASTSKGRKDLLERVGVQFTVEPSDYEEDMSLNIPPQELVKMFSQGKARAVAAKHSEGITIGADSIVVLDGKAIGKPKDEAHAREILRSLSGRGHTFLTGFTVIDIAAGKEITNTVETAVIFKEISPEELDAYLASGEPMQGHAAGYAVQGRAAVFIKRIEGEYTNIIGLPLYSLNEALREFGVSLLA